MYVRFKCGHRSKSVSKLSLTYQQYKINSPSVEICLLSKRIVFQKKTNSLAHSLVSNTVLMLGIILNIDIR